MGNVLFRDDWFDRLASATKPDEIRAPARLQSIVYSALMKAEAEEGPLASLSDCERNGRDLCFWERLIQITPLPRGVKALNHCHYCHARMLGERVEGVPLPWRGCPYAAFQK